MFFTVGARALIIGLAFVLTTFSTLAQTETGRVQGTVMDANGSVLQGATIVARSAQTGMTRRTTTSKSGTYAIPNLRAGTYEVTVEAPNFEKTMLQVRINIGSTARLDFTVHPTQEIESGP